MVYKIQFDERSAHYDKYAIFRNQFVIKKLCKDFVEKMNRQGYFYLNQLYEFFSMPWDTSSENPCFLVSMISWVKEDDGSYWIVVSGSNKKGEIDNDQCRRSDDAQRVS